MSVLDRLQLLLRSERSARRGESSVNVRGTLAEARRSLAEIHRSEKRLNREYQDALDAQRLHEDRAVEALRSGDEDLARLCLREKHFADRRAEEARRHLDRHRSEIVDLQSALDALELRIGPAGDHSTSTPPSRVSGGDGYREPGQRYSSYRSFRRRFDEESPTPRDEDSSAAPAPRSAPDEAPRTREPYPERSDAPMQLPSDADILADPGTFNSGSSDPFERFDEIEGRIDQLEAEAGSRSYLDEDPGWIDPLRDDLLDRFSELENNARLRSARRRIDEMRDRVDDPLRRLRRRMSDDED